MDPITHAISGAALARAFPKNHIQPKHLFFLVLLAMAPDSDILLRLFSDTVYLQHHRGLTHSLLMLPLWAWLVYSLASRSIRQNPVMPKLIILALLLHICLDLITTFGTMIFAPFSDRRFSFDLLFLIDPLFSACLLIPLLAGLIWKQQSRKLSILGFALAFTYLALAYHNQQQGMALARKAHPDAISYHALPMAFSPFNWQLIAKYPDDYDRAAVKLKPEFPGLSPLFNDAFVTSLLSTKISAPNHIIWQTLPAMHTLKGTTQLPGTAFYAWFARFPVLLEQNQQFIDFGDLAFGAGAPGVRSSFQLHIDLTDSDPAIPNNSNETSQPRAWLIWRGNQKSELTLRSAPFNWAGSHVSD
ncbi:MAG: metal-dependent hydrolase [Mariprofundus sp.]|nr:metal-dependent hydrolase [Mariprofundus sp.]